MKAPLPPLPLHMSTAQWVSLSRQDRGLRRDLLCDITLKVIPEKEDEETVEIKAHRAVLATWSPVFEAKFTEDESDTPIGFLKVFEEDVPAFVSMVEAMYSGKVFVDVDRAIELLKVAHKYKVEPIRMDAEDFLLFHINTANLCKIHEVAVECNERRLAAACIHKAQREFEPLVKEGKHTKYSKGFTQDLLRMDDIQCVSEITVYRAAVAWLKTNVDRETAAQTTDIDDLLSCIRFEHIPDQQQLLLVKEGQEEGVLRTKILKHVGEGHVRKLQGSTAMIRSAKPTMGCGPTFRRSNSGPLEKKLKTSKKELSPKAPSTPPRKVK